MKLKLIVFELIQKIKMLYIKLFNRILKLNILFIA